MNYGVDFNVLVVGSAGAQTKSAVCDRSEKWWLLL